MRRLTLFWVLMLVVVACGDGAAQDESTTAPLTEPSTTSEPLSTTLTTATTVALPEGCDEPLAEPGEYEGLNVVGDVEQPYWIVVPNSYHDVAPAPLYLHLAPGGGDHHGMMEGWRPYLDDLDGLMAMVNTEGAARKEVDVVASLVDQISAEYCVDPHRVHAMGTGTSFDMTERLACEYSDMIASFAASLGAGSGRCTPLQAVPLLAFTGDQDRGSVASLVERWVAANGCDPEPVVEDLGSGVYRKSYQNCDADILFYDIEGMWHAWPLHEAKGLSAQWVAEYQEVDYLEEAFSFFAGHPLL